MVGNFYEGRILAIEFGEFLEKVKWPRNAANGLCGYGV
jgi:hypothetical protein